MRIQHNIAALSAYRNLTTNNNAVSKSLEKLSSGYRINRAGDDAAGLAISEKMRAQITGLETAQKNANDGISLVQTAEGALTEVHSMLNRMVELAGQSANGTYDNDVDRVQLQKEITSLKEEIDRIADSSNFNGIKLLDGSAGLNKTAFSVGFGDAKAVEATTGEIDVSGKFAAKGSASPALHLGTKGVTKEVDPSFTVDLGDLKLVNKNADADGAVKVTFTFAGKDVEITVDKATNATTPKEMDAEAIAAAIETAFNADVKGADGSTTTKDSGLIDGKYAFKAEADGSKITFTFQGVKDANGVNPVANDYTPNDAGDDESKTFTEADATAINGKIGSDVKFEIESGKTLTQTGDIYHNTTGVQYAEAITDSKKAGIDFTLDSTIVAQGNKLTIGGTTYTFETEDATKTGANLINVASCKDATEMVHKAVELISQQTFAPLDDVDGTAGADFIIEAKDKTTLHFDQKVDDDKGLDTYEKLIDHLGIKAQGTPTDAANIGSTVKIDDVKAIKEGDALSINGKTYIFTKDGKADVPEGAVSINIKDMSAAEVAAALKEKIGAGASIDEADATKTKVIIRAASENDSAPAILGKGMVLQIGDTSESFNQMAVELKDCHTNVMGIGDVNISTQSGASDAVAKIKDAINYVSNVRGTLGALQNRLEHTVNNLSVQTENITAAESRIRDVDMAEEMMAYTKNNILVQASQAMLAQANQIPQGVLQLLQ